MSYRERLVAPVWWWVVGVGVAAGAAAEIHGGATGSRAVVPYVVLPLLAVLGLVALSRQQVTVEGSVLTVPKARAPVSAFGAPQVLDRAALREWRGPRAHRDAWVCVRPWLRRAVLLAVTDPADDTPYWLVGSRHPEQLAAAVRQAQV